MQIIGFCLTLLLSISDIVLSLSLFIYELYLTYHRPKRLSRTVFQFYRFEEQEVDLESSQNIGDKDDGDLHPIRRDHWHWRDNMSLSIMMETGLKRPNKRFCGWDTTGALREEKE